MYDKLISPNRYLIECFFIKVISFKYHNYLCFTTNLTQLLNCKYYFWIFNQQHYLEFSIKLSNNFLDSFIIWCCFKYFFPTQVPMHGDNLKQKKSPTIISYTSNLFQLIIALQNCCFNIKFSLKRPTKKNIAFLPIHTNN